MRGDHGKSVTTDAAPGPTPVPLTAKLANLQRRLPMRPNKTSIHATHAWPTNSK